MHSVVFVAELHIMNAAANGSARDRTDDEKSIATLLISHAFFFRPKKKLWKDDGKWLHDRYSDDAQAPKSREEIIAMYGYDIRSCDKPPDGPLPRVRGRGR
jgi:hypothetical protein